MFAEELVKIRPLHVREPLFLYRIRKDSMHQSLLKHIARVRVLLHAGVAHLEAQVRSQQSVAR